MFCYIKTDDLSKPTVDTPVFGNRRRVADDFPVEQICARRFVGDFKILVERDQLAGASLLARFCFSGTFYGITHSAAITATKMN